MKKQEQEMSLTMVTTTFEKYQKGNMEDTFDFVGLYYYQKIKMEDLEKQREYLCYYAQVPVVHLFLSKSME